MTQTALETIADGMRQAYAEHTNDNIVPWASAGAPQKAAWLVCASAALQALREPTGENSWFAMGFDGQELDVIHKAINAILQEKPEQG